MIISIPSFSLTANSWCLQSGDSDSTRNTMNPVVENANKISPMQEFIQIYTKDDYNIIQNNI